MRCVTVREVAETLGIRYKSAHRLLKRLERRGLLAKKAVGRVAVYCGDASLVEFLLNKKRNKKVKGWERLTAARALLQREGCVSTYALRRALGVDSEEARYTAAQLVEEGEAVVVVVGRTAIWCRDRAVAEATVERLRETVHRLVVANNMRYATPSKVLRAVQGDREAYALFSRFIPLSRIDARFSAVALAFADGVLRLLYGEPVARMRRKTVYAVSQPRPLELDIRDRIDKNIISVNIPDDLAAALSGADVDEVVLQAIEQLLARYRT
jgi:DNA-binding MarR family transcriptional regulator